MARGKTAHLYAVAGLSHNWIQLHALNFCRWTFKFTCQGSTPCNCPVSHESACEIAGGQKIRWHAAIKQICKFDLDWGETGSLWFVVLHPDSARHTISRVCRPYFYLSNVSFSPDAEATLSSESLSRATSRTTYLRPCSSDRQPVFSLLSLFCLHSVWTLQTSPVLLFALTQMVVDSLCRHKTRSAEARTLCDFSSWNTSHHWNKY